MIGGYETAHFNFRASAPEFQVWTTGVMSIVEGVVDGTGCKLHLGDDLLSPTVCWRSARIALPVQT